MRKIEIDDDVFAALQDRAIPLEDTPNSVLRKILGLEVIDRGKLAQAASSVTPRPRKTARARNKRSGEDSSARARKGTILPESEYELPLLEVIEENEGRIATRDALVELEKKLEGLLYQDDYESLSSGGIRWQSRAQFARLRMSELGDLRDDSPRGIWEISDQGRKRLADSRQ